MLTHLLAKTAALYLTGAPLLANPFTNQNRNCHLVPYGDILQQAGEGRGQNHLRFL